MNAEMERQRLRQAPMVQRISQYARDIQSKVVAQVRQQAERMMR
jgi:hypothetical protein